MAQPKKCGKKKLSALLVERNGSFIGLLTDTDIVRQGLGGEISLDQTTAEQLLTAKLPSIQVTRTSHEAYDMMGDLGVRHLVICDGEKIVEMVSKRDILLYLKSFEPKIGVD